MLTNELLLDHIENGGGGIKLPAIVQDAQAKEGSPRRSWDSSGSG